MSEKIGQFRATHDNPQGSDYSFQPDNNGDNLLRQAWGVVKGLGRGRSLDALNAIRLDPKSRFAQEKVVEAHDTNQFILGEGRFDTRVTVTEKPKSEPKKKKGRRHKL